MRNPLFADCPEWYEQTTTEKIEDEILQSEELQIESVYSFIEASQNLTDQEYLLLDDCFKKMPDLISRAVDWNAKRQAREVNTRA